MFSEKTIKGLCINENSGYYYHGHYYDWEKKNSVVLVYRELLEQNPNGQPPTVRQVAVKAKVGKTYASKVIRELHAFDTILDLQLLHEIHRDNNSHMIGGILEPAEEALLLDLLERNATRSLGDYVGWLQLYTGKRISITMLSNWFKRRFQYRATLKVAIKVPIDKFKP